MLKQLQRSGLTYGNFVRLAFDPYIQPLHAI